VTYRTRIDPLVARQMRSWGLTDYLWVETHLRLNERLPQSPTAVLRRDPSLFGDEGMVYGFVLIDPGNRLREHLFAYQVFYHADESTLLVAAGAYFTRQGA
jgi:hypothetical protein